MLAAIAVVATASFALAQDVTPLDLEGSLANGEVVAASCMGCHGADGHSRRRNTPHLAGQHEDYLKTQLWQFKTEQRTDRTMNGIAGGLSVQEIADVASYWSSLPPQGEPWPEQDDMLVVLGGEFFASGGGGVSSCSRCHGAAGEGNAERVRPRVWGLGPDYILNALNRYRLDDVEKPTPMHRVAVNLTEADIVVLQAFLASQPWGGEEVD